MYDLLLVHEWQIQLQASVPAYVQICEPHDPLLRLDRITRACPTEVVDGGMYELEARIKCPGSPDEEGHSM
jgi:hypothetical protein